METEDDVSVNWDEYAAGYDILNMLTPYQIMFNAIIIASNITGTMKILDAACGTGNLALYLKEKQPNCQANFTCLDFSTRMLESAKLKYAGLKAKFNLASLNDGIPYEDNIFDLIMSANTLYATLDPKSVLTEMQRVLKPDGRLILVTPKKEYSNKKILIAHVLYHNRSLKVADIQNLSDHALLRRGYSKAKDDVFQTMLRMLEDNEKIANSSNYYFYNQNDLVSQCKLAGFTQVSTSLTYAKQNILLMAAMN